MWIATMSVSVFATILLGINPISVQAATPGGFESITLDSRAKNYAFVTSSDLDRDGREELLVSVFPSFGGGGSPNGSVILYKSNGDLSQWTASELVAESAGIKYPNHVSSQDLDGDGDLDILVPYGFLACQKACGGLLWMENRNGDWIRHDIVANGSAFFYHKADFVDMNGDGSGDLVTTAEKKSSFGSSEAKTLIFFGDRSRPGVFSSDPTLVGAGGGSFQFVQDIDGDGDLDIASAQYFASGGSAVWFERAGSQWIKHLITDKVGPSIQLSRVPGIDENEPARFFISNHTNTTDRSSDPESGLYELTVPVDPRQLWEPRKVSSEIVSRKSSVIAPQAAPGIFSWGDIDNDFDTDILLGGDGSPNIYLMRQHSPGDYSQEVIADDMPQAGVHMGDLNGDGRMEIVLTSYEKRKILLFKPKTDR